MTADESKKLQPGQVVVFDYKIIGAVEAAVVRVDAEFVWVAWLGAIIEPIEHGDMGLAKVA